MSRGVLVPAESVYDWYFAVPEDSDDFEELIDGIREVLSEGIDAWTLGRGWYARETSILMDTATAIITISEYCGMAVLSVVPKDAPEDMWGPARTREVWRSIVRGWAEQLFEKSKEGLGDLGLKRCRHVGTFSNGEQVFELA